jgi:hypothetical protein
VAVIVAATVLIGTSLSALASTPTVDLSKKCAEAVDVTDSGQDIWVLCDGESVTAANMVEISDRSGKIVRNVEMPKNVAIPAEIVSNAQYVWILNGSGEEPFISQFSATTGTLIRQITGPEAQVSAPADIAATTNALWIIEWAYHPIVKLSAATGQVIYASQTNSKVMPYAIATTGNSLWVLNQYELPSYTNATEMNYSGAVIRSIRLSNQKGNVTSGVVPEPEKIAATPRDVWVEAIDGTVVEFDAANGHKVKTVRGIPPLRIEPNGSHQMFAVGDRLWLAEYDPSLYEVNARSGRIVGMSGSGTSSPLLQEFYGIAADAKHIWVMNSGFGELAEFKVSNEDLVRVFS